MTLNNIYFKFLCYIVGLFTHGITFHDALQHVNDVGEGGSQVVRLLPTVLHDVKSEDSNREFESLNVTLLQVFSFVFIHFPQQTCVSQNYWFSRQILFTSFQQLLVFICWLLVTFLLHLLPSFFRLDVDPSKMSELVIRTENLRPNREDRRDAEKTCHVSPPTSNQIFICHIGNRQKCLAVPTNNSYKHR